MAENNPIYKEENLTLRDHLDPDKHWIGDSLGVPTQSEIAATVGTVASPGDSPFVARADHQHKIDAVLLPAAGSIMAYIGTSAPTGWLLLNGATVTNGQTLYPALWAVIPAGWKSGANIVLPSMANRVPVGNNGTLGGIAGSMTHTLGVANLPSHTHDMKNHVHSLGAHTHDHIHTHVGAAHTHGLRDVRTTATGFGATGDIAIASASGTLITPENTGGASALTTGGPSVNATSGPSTPNTGAPNDNTTNSTGSGTAVDHTPAHLEVNFIIKT